LAVAGQLLAAGDGDFDRPPVGVARHDLLVVADDVGGEDRQDILAGLTHQHGAACGVGERAVPDGWCLGEFDGVGVAVTNDRGLPPARGGGR